MHSVLCSLKFDQITLSGIDLLSLLKIIIHTQSNAPNALQIKHCNMIITVTLKHFALIKLSIDRPTLSGIEMLSLLKNNIHT